MIYKVRGGVLIILERRRKGDRYDVIKLLHYLKLGYGRVNYLLAKVKSRCEGIELKLSSADSRGRDILLKELSSLKNLASSLARMSAIFEVLITRVETLALLSVTSKDLMTIKYVIQELKRDSTNIPELSIIVEDIEDKVNDLINSAKGSVNTFDTPITASQEAMKIINEANEIASMRLRELNA